MKQGAGNLFYNLLLFGRLLRRLGLDVDTGRMIELIQALTVIDITNKTDFYHTLRCLLVHGREDIPVFDRAFETFWRKPGGSRGMQVHGEGQVRRPPKPVIVPPLLRPPEADAASPNLPGPDPANEPPLIEATLTYSSREVLRRKNFAELSADELEEIRAMLSGLTWQPGWRRSRRWQPGKGSAVDLRHMLRRNLHFGGEVVQWVYKEPKYKPRPLVIIADISGSMERYTRLLLHFAYSLNRGFKQGVETFVFSTRLTRVTHSMQNNEVDRALREVSAKVPDWSGGTRIGAALKTFNYDWARRVLGRGAVVLLISDGWDQGEPELLRAEILRLQRSCYRLIWLNPLLGSPQYQPLTRGMQTALPYIDDFLPVHNIISLENLARHLERLNEGRRARRITNRRAERL
jgi:uncharacterized protein with von Willebrand factor type A (vWA) domain